MLNSFYNGIENIFKRVAVELGDPLPRGESWHQELLDSMAESTSHRRAVISAGLRTRLKEYMEFRHFFRHAYIFTLRWDRMKGLVLGCEETMQQLEAELDAFLRQLPQNSAGNCNWHYSTLQTGILASEYHAERNTDSNQSGSTKVGSGNVRDRD